MRITNTTIARNYSSSLNRNLDRLNRTNMGVYTGRKYMTMSENTSDAVRAMTVRRNLSKLEGYIDNTKSTKNKFDSAERILGQMNEIGTSISEKLVQAINGTNGPDERNAIANQFEQLQKELLSTANSQFADRSLFGGTNTETNPFTLADDGRLMYNGVLVADINRSDPDYDYLFNDAGYVDLGFGLTMQGNSQQVVTNSVFKNTINGLDFMGTGDTNMYDNITDIINLLREGNFDESKAGELLNQLRDNTNNVNLQRTVIGADCTHLDFTLSRLQTEQDNLIERQDTLEFQDPAEAIMDFTMQQYVYNAALQMGSKILQPTIFNFIS